MIFDICFERTYIMKTCVDLFSTLALIVHNCTAQTAPYQVDHLTQAVSSLKGTGEEGTLLIIDSSVFPNARNEKLNNNIYLKIYFSKVK